MKEDWEGINPEEMDGEPVGNEAGEETIVDGDAEVNSLEASKFDKVTGDDSRRYKLSGMFKDWFLDYASYVILQRAVPDIVDGLKPVQRRILHSMWKDDTGELVKVANTVGRVMAYHPHGDQSILGALVQMGQKGYLIDCQGNWGDPITGARNAAMRYIEGRLSAFAKDVVFDPKVTEWMTSYDGKNQEPVELPVRFPILLAQGAEGIAVGMSCKILPHNFNELIDASIDILHGKDFEIYPDFPTGGFADCSRYQSGRMGGRVKVRAKIEKIDKNTLAITEVPYGVDTPSLIDSILKAKDKGKIKIKKIEDMSAAGANVQIHLPNDVSPDKTIDALYACTNCEVSIATNACVIKDNKPEFLDVKQILIYSTEHTKDLIRQRLEIRKSDLENDWHYFSLERIFFENRVYKILEQDQKTWEIQIDEVLAKMKEYEHELRRKILMEDILKLVEKPVRKISKFDTKVIDEKIAAIDREIAEVQDHLDNLTEYTVEYFRNIKKKYGKGRDRCTELVGFENITVTKVISNNAKLYANLEEGFVGMALKREDNGQYLCDCSDMSEIVVFGKDGKYRVTKVSDKAFFGKNLLYAGVFNRGDERTIYNVIYRDGKSSVYYAKRFAITSTTRDKEYDITAGKPDSQILWFSVNHNGEAETVRVILRPRPKLKKTSFEYDFSKLAIKGKGSRGNLVSKFQIKTITLKSKGISTIGGKDIWYDTDVQRLNEDGRGLLLGQFSGDDKILAIFRDGTFYTTSYDLSNRYQGDVLRIEKLDEGKTWTALYWDGVAKSFYIKRFSFPISDNTPMSFISESKGSKLIDISDDKHPQFIVTFAGKYAHREPEQFDAEGFIAKKGITAKGKKCSAYDLKTVEFGEPLHKPEDEMPEAGPEVVAGNDVPDTQDDTMIEPGKKIELPAIDMEEPEDMPETRPAGDDEEPSGEDGDELTLFDI